MPNRANRRPDGAAIESVGESKTVSESELNARPQIEFKPTNAEHILSEVISRAGFTLSSALKSVSSVTISEPNCLELELGVLYDFQRRVIEQTESRAAIEAIVRALTGVTAALSLKIVVEDDLTADNFIRKMKMQSEEFAKKSTQLSKMLEQAEHFLQHMPGKFRVFVGKAPDSLSFERRHNDWKLFYGHEPELINEGEYLLHPLHAVTSASVTTKAKAAILLPELFETIVTTSASQLSSVDKGLKALQTIPFLKGDG